MNDFESFNLSPEILYGIADSGYKSPTPIQAAAIPIILQGKDLIACAQTGTGKTAAFLVPLLAKMQENSSQKVRSLILSPTRELAKQIEENLEGLAYHTSVSSIAVYGGTKGDVWSQQKEAFILGAEIVIATPGRLISHLGMKYLDFSSLEILILDEADKMLDMGFSEDILKIISNLPKERQTLLFSATMPPKIREFAKRILNNPEEISLSIAKPSEKVKQLVFPVYPDKKLQLLSLIFQNEKIESMILFTGRKREVDKITQFLRSKNINALGLHSDKEQSVREDIIRKFRNKEFPVLVATDVMSRGIDVEGLSHVLNFDVPADAEDYVHRIGRTARADAKGVAITLVCQEEVQKLQRIEKLIGYSIEKIILNDPPDVSAKLEDSPSRFKRSPNDREFRGNKKPFVRNKPRTSGDPTSQKDKKIPGPSRESDEKS